MVITDVRMPRMDGMALIQAIDEQWPDVQIVILTGYESFDYARTALKCGATDYLLKPVRFDELKRAVGRMRDRLAQITEACRQIAPKDARNIAQVVAASCDYIRGHYHENLSLADMNARYFLNASYFCEQFARHAGRSFVEYLTDARMEAALRLLRDRSEFSVTDVAMRVGYQDARYFGQVFRKRYGMTPSEYKKGAE